ncbi:MAG TPA: beta-propeller domain-containing protein [Polyangia bacterium]|nr:beta-propeller domain-containing protein [Polyangia bacterium]
MAASVAGCAGQASSGGQAAESTAPPTGTPSPTTTTGTSDVAQRAISEADIIQIDGGILYAMSKSGTVSLVDVSTEGRLALLGQTTLPGQPFEMYRRGSVLLAMSNGAVAADGHVTSTYQSPDTGAGAMVVTVSVANPAQPYVLAALPVPGEIADSRVVGDVLYLATYENAACYQCGSASRTMVTTFNIAVPTAMTLVEQVSFQSNAPDGYNLPWGSNWKRSIFVTDERLYVAGHADIDPNSFGTAHEGIIDVLDITDPTGRLRTGARLSVAGAILSRWQMDERDGVLRVISQQGAGRTGNGVGAPQIETFQVVSSQSFVPLGRGALQLPRQEGLRSVRFDGDRAYAITYNQTDPMFVIDLSKPVYPRQRGALYMPGFMFYLEPHGDRVIGLGIDRTDTRGSLNVSLFDVTNADAPTMLARVPFATPGITEDYEILNSEISEDQDRIQKAFHVYPDGLVVVPFTALHPYGASGGTCANDGGGMQLVSWQSDTLAKRALLPLPGNPRRALENGVQAIAVSDSNVRAFSLADLDVAHQTADLVIGTCVPDADAPTVYQPPAGGGYHAAEAGGAPGVACAMAPGARSPRVWPVLFLAISLVVVRCRRRRPVR